MPRASSRRSRSRSRSVRRIGKPSEYSKARKQLDGSRFIVQAKTIGSCTLQATRTIGDVAIAPAFMALLSSPMFRQLEGMYDEFRVQSLKVKITPNTQGVAGTNWMLNTAFDRNGRFCIHRGIANPGDDIFEEERYNMTSYSSLITKALLQYQSGSLSRTLAAANMQDKFFFPTAYGEYLRSGAAGTQEMYPDVKRYLDGKVLLTGPQGFQPFLLMQINSNGVAYNELKTISVTLDWEFEVYVRGLRTTGADE